MKVFKAQVELSAAAMVSRTFFDRLDAVISQQTVDWPDRRRVAQAHSTRVVGRGETLSQAIQDADLEFPEYTMLSYRIESFAGDSTRRCSIEVLNSPRRGWVFIEGPSEVEVEGLASVAGRLVDEVSATEEDQGASSPGHPSERDPWPSVTNEAPPSAESSGPNPERSRGRNWLQHPWVITIVGGLIVAVIAAFLLRGRASRCHAAG